MEEKSLRITGTSTTFFNKLTKTLTRMLIPTQLSINNMLISIKRNNLIKAFENYQKGIPNDKIDELEKKYDETYAAYLEALDKYVMDSIYKKVKNNTASEFERDALSKYYEVTSLKENEYIEYKYNIYNSSKEWIYVKIFYTLEDYAENILPLKMQIEEPNELKNIEDDYEKFESYTVGKLDTKDSIEKNMVLLGLSRKIFTHSIPLVVAEQCYEKLLKDARTLVQDTKMAVKRENAYNMLINLIEDYNVRLLSTKVYWENPKERENYKKYWDKYKKISKLKDTDFDEYKKQKEILFIKKDMERIKDAKFDYSKIIKYYKRKLLDYGAIRELKTHINQ